MPRLRRVLHKQTRAEEKLMNSKMCGRGVRLGATVAVAGALALSLAGCGSSDETAQQLNASDETNASGVTVGA